MKAWLLGIWYFWSVKRCGGCFYAEPRGADYVSVIACDRHRDLERRYIDALGGRHGVDTA